MANPQDETVSWSGEGVGTSVESFLAKLNRELPEFSPTEAAEAVLYSLCERLPGGLVQDLFEQLPRDMRTLCPHCLKDRTAPARPFDKDDFYLEVAEHLQVQPEEVRLVLHHVFAALHSQITEGLSERLVSELPPNVAGTWMAARRDADLPR